MTKAELDGFRQQLETLRQRLTGDVSQLATEALRQTEEPAGGNLSNTPIHMADLGSDNFEQEFSLGLLQNEERALEEIADALERLHQGTYGLCEECRQEIPKPRLHALPYARHCVACALKLQQSA